MVSYQYEYIHLNFISCHHQKFGFGVLFGQLQFHHLQISRSSYDAHEHSHLGPMGICPYRCTPTDQDSSNELDLKWMGSVFAELWHPQFRLHEPMDRWRQFRSPHLFFQELQGTKSFENSFPPYLAYWPIVIKNHKTWTSYIVVTYHNGNWLYLPKKQKYHGVSDSNSNSGLHCSFLDWKNGLHVRMYSGVSPWLSLNWHVTCHRWLLWQSYASSCPGAKLPCNEMLQCQKYTP